MILPRPFNLDRMKNLDLRLDNQNFNWDGDTKEYTYLGVSTTKTDDGAKVTNVTKDSPADKAGIQKDDIIYKIDDTKIDGTDLFLKRSVQKRMVKK
jgi:serine protease Do